MIFPVDERRVIALGGRYHLRWLSLAGVRLGPREVMGGTVANSDKTLA